MNVLVIIALCVILGVLGQIFMKRGMNAVGKISITNIFSREIFSIVFERFVFIGITLYLLASLFWLVVLSRAEVSYAYPLIGTGYILTAILGWILFKENLTALRLLGTILISAGVYLIVVKV